PPRQDCGGDGGGAVGTIPPTPGVISGARLSGPPSSSGGSGTWLACRIECRLDHVLDPLCPQKAQGVACGLRDLLVILAVACRQDDGGETGAGSGNDLLLDAADRR